MRTFAFVVGFVFSFSGWGQTITVPVEQIKKEVEQKPAESAAPQTEAPKPKVERVQVTGSHIKRIDVEGAAPVQTITRREMEKTGYNSVADVLRDTTANSFGSVREQSGSNAAGVAHVNLRGLGSSNTLVLLNGQRLPSDAVTGAVDLNLIPMAAVERIEVLKDGASATYGSDALGGVVNIITRKDFSGNEVSLAQTTPEAVGGKRQEISLVNGINRGRFNMVNVVQYRDNDKIYSRDREWSNNGTSNIGSPGSYRNPDGTWNADANCPPGRLVVTPGGNFCSFKHTDYSTQLPALQQLSLLSESNMQLSSRVKMKARIGGSQKKAQWSYAPAPGTFTIKGNVADHLGPGGNPLPGVNPGEDLEVRYRLSELGTRDTEVETKSVNALIGSTVDVGKGWEIDANAGHNYVETMDKGVSGYALTKDLESSIENGSFNPFAPEGQRGSIEHTRYQPWEKMTSELSSFEMKGSGEIGHVPAGRMGLAIGTQYTFQKYRDKFDDRSVNDEVFGNAGSSGGGQRDTRAVFTELSIPVTEKIELQLAGRYDQYSDFGDTVNPKIATLYRPNRNWLVRGSAGTGFKAPLMQDLYAATSNGFPTFIDHVSCARERAAGGATPSCKPQQYQVTSSGNSGLKEEKSMSYNLGTVYQPNRDFNIGTDLFLTRLNNVVGISYDDAMEAEAKFGPDYLAQHGVIVHRDAQGYIESIEAPQQNLSAQEVAGIDVGTSYRISKVKLSAEHSQLFYFKEEGFPGTGAKNKLGENGRPPWRNTLGLSFIPNDRHDLSLSALTTARHQKSVAAAGNLRAYTTVDLQYSFNARKVGVFTAGVKNVMGTTPPLDDSDPNNMLDTTIYDQVGRAFYTGYKATF